MKKLTLAQKKAAGLKRPKGLTSYAKKSISFKNRCPDCMGRGQIGGDKCIICNGTGRKGGQ